MNSAGLGSRSPRFRLLTVGGVALVTTLTSIGLPTAAPAAAASGLHAVVGADGSYSVSSSAPAWTFKGAVGAPASNVVSAPGSDGLGTYQEVSFDYHVDVDRTSKIRVYDAQPVVLFTTVYRQVGPNAHPFPTLTSSPALPYHLGFNDTIMGHYNFSHPGIQGPAAYFDASGNAFIFSPAANYMIAADNPKPPFSGGIDSHIPSLPAGFTHSTALVIGSGINSLFNTWGHALQAIGGYTRPANDATTELNKLGYWTDHGAAYYYNHISGKNYEQTYETMRDAFASAGFPLGYMQLDAWWFQTDGSPVPPGLLPNVPATGLEKLNATVALKDSSKRAISGDNITTSTSGTCGTVNPSSGTSDSSGAWHPQYYGGSSVGFCTLTARESNGGATGSVLVTTTLSPRPQQQTALTSTTSACPAGINPPCVAADGVSTLQVQGHVTGPANASDKLWFTQAPSAPGSCGAVSPSATITDASGAATGIVYTASNMAGSCRVTLIEANGDSSAAITITQGTGGSTAPGGNQVVFTTQDIGVYQYIASGYLPSGLGGFHQALGLPLITHSRWVSYDSPYRAQYGFSRNVSTDPAFWSNILGYTSQSGADMFEQDWLSGMAQPAENLTDPEAFMATMAAGAAANNETLLYGMPQARHYLEAMKFPNATTTRVSNDRFSRSNWDAFLYDSRLAESVGLWPWSDVFLSSETSNLMLSVLSGGMVGVGDAQGAINAGNLAQAVRSDGVIVKPDLPITPVDAMYIADAQSGNQNGGTQPMIASTVTDHNGARTAYIFAYTRGGGTSISFTPAQVGIQGPSYVYNYFTHKGSLLGTGQAFNDTLTDFSYYLVAPVGQSGIAFLGDRGKFASMGKKRVPGFSDNGTVSATIAFAPTETSTTVFGYSPTAPIASATNGSVGAVTYDTSTHIFSLGVSPGTGQTAMITLTP